MFEPTSQIYLVSVMVGWLIIQYRFYVENFFFKKNQHRRVPKKETVLRW
jgi:hypothetical protein